MRPDLDAIRARYLGEDTLAPPGAVLDVEVLLAYIDELERRTTYTVGETEWAQRSASLEHMLSEERENVDTLRARVAELEAEAATLRHRDALLKRAHDALTDAGSVQPLAFDGTIEHAIKDLARRATRAEQLFVDESDAHQETRKLLTDLYMKQLRADAAQMREYGISYDGVRKVLAEYDGGELSLGKVLELLRAAARELAKEEIAELKARITTLEAMR